MPFFKKGIIYSVLFFVVIWMFVLGVFVGRDSAPVKFDTRKFQKRLANISSKYETEHKSSEETDIQFYEALQKPMPVADNLSKNQTSVTPILSEPAKVENKPNAKDEDKESKANTKTKIALKVSQKSMTKAKYSALNKSKPTPKSIESAESAKPVSVSKEILNEKKEGKYTIQIAAFKDVSGAIEKISLLKVKGYSGYKTLGKVQDQIWHRVRIGHFSDTEVARQYLRKLKKDNINGIIIRQD
ncbi:MAG: SPOR domain-containing protein [Desulfobacterales bacterium]|nr:SPOR domain-containing protein [Desulfobacterales bacterium]